MKAHHVRVLTAVGLAFLVVLVRTCLADGPPGIILTFDQWRVTTGPTPYVATYEGPAAGDVKGRIVTRVLEHVEVGGQRIMLKAQYEVYGSSDPAAALLFVAEVAGEQNGTEARLEGSILQGWQAGLATQVRFDVAECEPGNEGCLRGVLFTSPELRPAMYWFGCKKWVTEWPRMAGVVEHAPDGTPATGTFTGEVLEATPSADGTHLRLRARYVIALGEQTFTAQVEGDQENETGISFLVGTVTSGWYRGAHVRAEFQATTCDGHSLCWQGGIRVAAVPATITPSTALQHTAVHLNRPSSFTVTATGTTPLTFQWRRDGVDLPGRTNRTLTISSAQPADEGDYTVEVRNPGGTVISPAARLVVVPPTAECLKRNFTNAAGVRIPYVIHVPANYDPSRRYPLVCFLHGASLNESALPAGFEDWPNVVAVTSYRQQATDPVIMVWPALRSTDADWSPAVLRQVLDLLDTLAVEYNLDPQRFYVGGYSLGVAGVWNLLGLRPDFFAGALVWAGGAGNAPARTIKDVPLWAFLARDDPFGVGSLQNLIAALREAGGHPLYSEFNTGGHEGPMRIASCSPVVLNWLFAQRRGQPPPPPFAVEVVGPDGPPPPTTGASALGLAGSARTIAGTVTAVSWENRANRLKGAASTHRQAETTFWAINDLPLATGKTNVLIVTATLDTTWAPAFGGATTFSDTISVFSTPVRLGLRIQGHDAILDWTGGVPPFAVQRAPTVDAAAWEEVFSNVTPPVTVPALRPAQFYRVAGR
jgi:predicted esterase